MQASQKWQRQFMKGTTGTPTTRAQHVYYTKPPANTPDGSSDREMTVGNLSNDECDEGSENVVKKKKKNLHSFKLYRVY